MHAVGLASVLQLVLILGRVEMALGRRNQAIGSDAPFFKAADLNLVSVSSRTTVCACQGPMVLRTVRLNSEIVHSKLQVGKRSHERPSEFGDFFPANGRSSAVDRQRTAGREERSHALGVLATPGCGVALCESPWFVGIRLHSIPCYQVEDQTWRGPGAGIEPARPVRYAGFLVRRTITRNQRQSSLFERLRISSVTVFTRHSPPNSRDVSRDFPLGSGQ